MEIVRKLVEQPLVVQPLKTNFDIGHGVHAVCRWLVLVGMHSCVYGWGIAKHFEKPTCYINRQGRRAKVEVAAQRRWAPAMLIEKAHT